MTLSDCSSKSLVDNQYILSIAGVELGMVVACLQHRCFSWLVDDGVLHICYVLRVKSRFPCRQDHLHASYAPMFHFVWMCVRYDIGCLFLAICVGNLCQAGVSD